MREVTGTKPLQVHFRNSIRNYPKIAPHLRATRVFQWPR